MSIDYSLPSLRAMTKPIAKVTTLVKVEVIVKLTPSNVINTTIGEASTSPRMELYVGASHRASRNSISFAMANIPATTPSPNGIKIIKPPRIAAWSKAIKPLIRLLMVSTTGV